MRSSSTGKVGGVVPPRIELTQAMGIAGGTGKTWGPYQLRLPAGAVAEPSCTIRASAIHAPCQTAYIILWSWAASSDRYNGRRPTYYMTRAVATTSVTSTNRVQNRLAMADRIQHVNELVSTQLTSKSSRMVRVRHQGLSQRQLHVGLSNFAGTKFMNRTAMPSGASLHVKTIVRKHNGDGPTGVAEYNECIAHSPDENLLEGLSSKKC